MAKSRRSLSSRKLVEHVGGEDHEGGTVICTPANCVGDPEVAEQMADEGQRAGLAPQGTFADAGEAVVGVEGGGVEVAHRLPGLLAPVGSICSMR